LQLVLICHRVLHSNRSYLHQHVLPQLVNLLNPFLLYRGDGYGLGVLLLSDMLLVDILLLDNFILVRDKLLQRLLFRLELRDLLVLSSNQGLVLSSERLDICICIRPLILRRLNCRSFLAQKVFLFDLSVPTLLEVSSTDVFKTPIVVFDVTVLFLFLLEQLRSVLLEPPIDVLQAVDQDVEFNVLSLDQLLRHLQVQWIIFDGVRFAFLTLLINRLLR